MRNYFLLLFCLTLFVTCQKPNDDMKPCEKTIQAMQGTYEIGVTSYPLQTSQEGDTIEVLVFLSLKGCTYSGSQDVISFNNLFTFFGCDRFSWLKKNTFNVVYEDGKEWNGAPIRGTGSIVNGLFHFEGFVVNSDTEWPIVLNGKKKTYFQRTSAC